VAKGKRTAGGKAPGKKKDDVESRTLASLRDTLLPKLITDELRVRDAERFVSAAV
jgi:hypothetical protein